MATFKLEIHKMRQSILPVGVFAAAMFCIAAAQAQTVEPKSSPEARVVVVGEGSVSVAPDYARIRSGVSTNAKTVKEASDTNSKLMSNIIATLADAGIAKKDIQTSEFSIEPVYASPTPPGGPKLSGYRVSNQVNVTIHDIAQVGEVLDRLVKAGATDAGNIAFLVSDREKALDQAREAAIANARHKADLYTRASGRTWRGHANGPRHGRLRHRAIVVSVRSRRFFRCANGARCARLARPPWGRYIGCDITALVAARFRWL